MGQGQRPCRPRVAIRFAERMDLGDALDNPPVRVMWRLRTLILLRDLYPGPGSIWRGPEGPEAGRKARLQLGWNPSDCTTAQTRPRLVIRTLQSSFTPVDSWAACYIWSIVILWAGQGLKNKEGATGSKQLVLRRYKTNTVIYRGREKIKALHLGHLGIVPIYIYNSQP